MSNFILEKLPVIEPVDSPELLLDAQVQQQIEQAPIPEQPTQAEIILGMLARRAATADYYSLLTANRDAKQGVDTQPSEAAKSWKYERDRWHYEASNFMGRCPKLYATYHQIYSDVFSHLFNPDR